MSLMYVLTAQVLGRKARDDTHDVIAVSANVETARKCMRKWMRKVELASETPYVRVSVWEVPFGESASFDQDNHFVEMHLFIDGELKHTQGKIFDDSDDEEEMSCCEKGNHGLDDDNEPSNDARKWKSLQHQIVDGKLKAVRARLEKTDGVEYVNRTTLNLARTEEMYELLLPYAFIHGFRIRWHDPRQITKYDLPLITDEMDVRMHTWRTWSSAETKEPTMLRGIMAQERRLRTLTNEVDTVIVHAAPHRGWVGDHAMYKRLGYDIEEDVTDDECFPQHYDVQHIRRPFDLECLRACVHHAHLIVEDRGMKYNNPKEYYGTVSGDPRPWHCRQFDDRGIPNYLSKSRYLRTLYLRTNVEERTLTVWYDWDS